jgi:hypothetical protein
MVSRLANELDSVSRNSSDSGDVGYWTAYRMGVIRRHTGSQMVSDVEHRRYLDDTDYCIGYNAGLNGRGKGRPRLSPSTVTVSLTLPEEHHLRLKHIADRDGLTLPNLYRAIIAEYFGAK